MLSSPASNVAEISRKNKKSPQNAFSLYLHQEFLKLRKTDKTLQKSDIITVVYNKWKVLDSDEKRPYEVEAKLLKAKKYGGAQVDSTHVSLDGQLVNDELSKQRRFEGSKHFTQMWSVPEGGASTVYHIISFQSIYELPNEEGYKPCEVACVKYSLKRGVIGQWHRFINPGKIELGLRAEIKCYSETYHRISEEMYKQFCSRYTAMWMELLSFVEDEADSESLPPLLCMV
uniref:Protein maelstrom homolog n=1 Tax=Ciona savignyi TaxID=51511 RepID=H2ZD20_CIOSA